MDLDLINNDFYNSYSTSFDKIPFNNTITGLLLKHLPATPQQILEIGSGPGALAVWLTQLGHQVTCIEPAEKAAEIARKKGLNVCVSKLQDFESDQKYDLILAISSLIHLPKNEIPTQISKIAKLLKTNGTVILTFIEGNTEGFEDPTGKGKMRFFTKFAENELTDILSVEFTLLEIEKLEVKSMNQTFFIFTLKKY
jgi:2-polyprenyl-3-methyl-5-hydroxy-6-metoxy-1,4-benzoquinol methylase